MLGTETRAHRGTVAAPRENWGAFFKAAVSLAERPSASLRLLQKFSGSAEPLFSHRPCCRASSQAALAPKEPKPTVSMPASSASPPRGAESPRTVCSPPASGSSQSDSLPGWPRSRATRPQTHSSSESALRLGLAFQDLDGRVGRTNGQEVCPAQLAEDVAAGSAAESRGPHVAVATPRCTLVLVEPRSALDEGGDLRAADRCAIAVATGQGAATVLFH